MNPCGLMASNHRWRGCLAAAAACHGNLDVDGNVGVRVGLEGWRFQWPWMRDDDACICRVVAATFARVCLPRCARHDTEGPAAADTGRAQPSRAAADERPPMPGRCPGRLTADARNAAPP